MSDLIFGGVVNTHSAVDGAAYRPFDGGPALTVQDAARQRGFALAEISQLAERCGFAVHGVLGGLVEGMTLDDPKASHMVVVLRSS